MKLFAGWLGASILVLSFTGCGDDTDAAVANAPPPTADGRPAGFEEQMRGMEKNMKDATSKNHKAGAAKPK